MERAEDTGLLLCVNLPHGVRGGCCFAASPFPRFSLLIYCVCHTPGPWLCDSVRGSSPKGGQVVMVVPFRLLTCPILTTGGA